MYIVILTHTGQLGRLPEAEIQSQSRGGRGAQSFPLEQGDRVIGMSAASDADKVLVFTAYGRAFGLEMASIPELSEEQEPAALVDLVSLQEGEAPVALMAASFEKEQQLLFATRGGIVKKTDTSEFATCATQGLIAIRLDEEDALAGVSVVEEGKDVFVATRSGQAIRFDQSEVKATGRNTRGVCGIRLQEGDEVASLLMATSDDAIATVTEHGFGKRTMAEEYRCTSRSGKGITSIKSSERNGAQVALAVASDELDLLLATQTGRILRTPAESIRVQSRNTAGVRLFKLEGEEAVVSALGIG